MRLDDLCTTRRSNYIYSRGWYRRLDMAAKLDQVRAIAVEYISTPLLSACYYTASQSADSSGPLHATSPTRTPPRTVFVQIGAHGYVNTRDSP